MVLLMKYLKQQSNFSSVTMTVTFLGFDSNPNVINTVLASALVRSCAWTVLFECHHCMLSGCHVSAVCPWGPAAIGQPTAMSPQTTNGRGCLGLQQVCGGTTGTSWGVFLGCLCWILVQRHSMITAALKQLQFYHQLHISFLLFSFDIVIDIFDIFDIGYFLIFLILDIVVSSSTRLP